MKFYLLLRYLLTDRSWSCEYRVISCQENLQMSGNLTAVRECQGIDQNHGSVRKNSCREKLSVAVTSSFGLRQCLIDSGHLVSPVLRILLLIKSLWTFFVLIFIVNTDSNICLSRYSTWAGVLQLGKCWGIWQCLKIVSLTVGCCGIVCRWKVMGRLQKISRLSWVSIVKKMLSLRLTDVPQSLSENAVTASWQCHVLWPVVVRGFMMPKKTLILSLSLPPKATYKQKLPQLGHMTGHNSCWLANIAWLLDAILTPGQRIKSLVMEGLTTERTISYQYCKTSPSLTLVTVTATRHCHQHRPHLWN